MIRLIGKAAYLATFVSAIIRQKRQLVDFLLSMYFLTKCIQQILITLYFTGIIIKLVKKNP